VRVLANLKSALERLLEAVVLLLMFALAAVVIVAVAYRTFGAPLSWYDEVASVMLAWLTYYGAALAALKRAHIGFAGIVDGLRRAHRLAAVLLAEALVVGFFVLLAWVGYEVLVILEGDSLVSLPEVPTQLTQSVIPIGAALFVICRLLSLPDALRDGRSRPH
jgi:TRAP-type C4-dicarboxylate transport system permease small subunit